MPMKPKWRKASDDKPLGHVFTVRLVPDESGGYWAYVPRLPGTISEGNSIKAAKENIAEALRMVLDYYAEANLPLPLVDETEKAEHEIEFRIAASPGGKNPKAT